MVGSTATALDAASQAYTGKRYHFIGIGGIGMSSLARLLLAWGAIVSGSDRAPGEMLEILGSEGARVAIGHSAKHLGDPLPDVVVYSKAIQESNPELAAARKSGVRTIHRAELLAEMMATRKAICICGTHGKSTTTAMLAAILAGAGKDPAVMLGGMYGPLGGNVRNGKGEVFIAEACEAYGSFLSLYPDLAVVTNIEADHLDASTTFQDIRDSFETFLGRVPPSGAVIAGVDSPEVRRLIPRLSSPVITYGLLAEGSPQWTAEERDDRYLVRNGAEEYGLLRLKVPGDHNLSNALAAIAVSELLGISPSTGLEALSHFTGVDRRFSIRGAAAGILVVDDYAHHPTEIRANLAAARRVLSGSQGSSGIPSGYTPGSPGRLVAIFQPHLYSRTANFMDEFADSFADADIIAITEIYAARESPQPGVSGAVLAEKTRFRWLEKTVLYVPELATIPERIGAVARKGDLVMVMGAGDITGVTEPLLTLLSGGKRE